MTFNRCRLCLPKIFQGVEATLRVGGTRCLRLTPGVRRSSGSVPRPCAVISIITRRVNETGNRSSSAHVHKTFVKSGWRSLPARLSPLCRIGISGFELNVWENVLATPPRHPPQLLASRWLLVGPPHSGDLRFFSPSLSGQQSRPTIHLLGSP